MRKGGNVMKKHIYKKIIFLFFAVVMVLSVSMLPSLNSNAATEATIKISFSSK